MDSLVLSYLPALKEIHIEKLVQLNGELNGGLQVAHAGADLAASVQL